MKSPNASARIERSLRQRLLSAYRRDLRIPPERIIVGFSGGPDSLALAILLAGVQRAIPARIHLLHVDHRIRPESGDEAGFCASLADWLGLQFTSVHVPDHPLELHPGLGLEEAARRARYQAFAKVSGDGDVVALAHHAGDQAETVLLHLMRGAGISGIAGMRAVSELPVPWWDGDEAATQTLTVWRPLLAERRKDLLAIVEQRRLTPLIDPTNDDISLKRNAIRHQVMPALRQVEPTIEERLGILARIASDEDELLETQAKRLFADSGLPCGGLAIKTLLDTPVALARRVVRRWLEGQLSVTPPFERVEAVLELARSGDQTARLEIGDGQLAGCFDDALRAGTLECLQQEAWADACLCLPLVGCGARPVIDHDTITLPALYCQGSNDAARSTDADGQVGVARVCQAMPVGDADIWNEWFRKVHVSPWIRDQVQGVTIDGVLWWIPRLGDYDDAGSGRLVRVVWNEEDRE